MTSIKRRKSEFPLVKLLIVKKCLYTYLNYFPSIFWYFSSKYHNCHVWFVSVLCFIYLDENDNNIFLILIINEKLKLRIRSCSELCRELQNCCRCRPFWWLAPSRLWGLCEYSLPSLSAMWVQPAVSQGCVGTACRLLVLCEYSLRSLRAVGYSLPSLKTVWVQPAVSQGFVITARRLSELCEYSLLSRRVMWVQPIL